MENNGEHESPDDFGIKGALNDHPELIEDREFWYQAEYFDNGHCEEQDGGGGRTF